VPISFVSAPTVFSDLYLHCTCRLLANSFYVSLCCADAGVEANECMKVFLGMNYFH
jgi:hypothetical protein